MKFVTRVMKVVLCLSFWVMGCETAEAPDAIKRESIKLSRSTSAPRASASTRDTCSADTTCKLLCAGATVVRERFAVMTWLCDAAGNTLLFAG